MLQSSYAPITHLGWEISLKFICKKLLVGRKICFDFVVEFVDNLLSLNVIMNQRVTVEITHNKVRVEQTYCRGNELFHFFMLTAF